MNLKNFCTQIKDKFPEISGKADQHYHRYWGGLVEVEFSPYSWFESLASVINGEMARKVHAELYAALFSEISRAYLSGNEDLKKAIDVAFVENLFWQIKPDDAAPYWLLLPANLRTLYMEFHGRTPIK